MAENVVSVVNPDGTRVGTSGTSTVTVTSGTVTAQPFVATSLVTNTAPTTSPGATATIATIASGSIPAGTYSVLVHAVVGGTVAAADLGNLTFTCGATVARLAVGDANNTATFGPFLLPGATTMTVATVGAGTASSVYGATIVATRVL